MDNEGWVIGVVVSKLFRAYRLYNLYGRWSITESIITFQSSFELTGYITGEIMVIYKTTATFQSSFELTGYITRVICLDIVRKVKSFKALSSLQVI